MEEIIVIRATDPDGSMFQTIMDALRGRRAEVIEMTAPSHDSAVDPVSINQLTKPIEKHEVMVSIQCGARLCMLADMFLIKKSQLLGNSGNHRNRAYRVPGFKRGYIPVRIPVDGAVDQGMIHMDTVILKINIIPHQTGTFGCPHPGA